MLSLKALVVTCGIVVALGAALVDAFPATPARTTYLTFNVPIGLPGVTLPAGTYIFERAEPFGNPNVVRVLARDRSAVYLMALTRTIPRPHGMKSDVFVTLGEAVAGRVRPITAWFPAGGSSGNEFIY